MILNGIKKNIVAINVGITGRTMGSNLMWSLFALFVFVFFQIYIFFLHLFLSFKPELLF